MDKKTAKQLKKEIRELEDKANEGQKLRRSAKKTLQGRIHIRMG